MKIKTILTSIIGIIVLSSCANVIKFPVSSAVPAANITAKTKKQGKMNYMVTIDAENLAASERLNPPKKTYVIWVVSERGITRNAGHFHQENAKKAEYKATFPYQPKEIFITAEDEEGSCYPLGTEITRVRL
jgi:hypothetical protein